MAKSKSKSSSKKSSSKKETSKKKQSTAAKKHPTRQGFEAAKQISPIGVIVSFLAWLTGVIVSLAIGFGMIDRVLTITWVPAGITVFFGWVVVITTILGVIFAIAKQFE
ncbi:MAG: hypothetical protein ABEI74_01915 [Candidatus Pacearchaeota archaeon]